MEFQKAGLYDLMYMKTKELGWKETQDIQNIGIEDSQGNRIIKQSQVLKIWENYITELHDRPSRQQSQKLNLKRKKMKTRSAHIFCKVKRKSHKGKVE
jgi:hypothetical protein